MSGAGAVGGWLCGVVVLGTGQLQNLKLESTTQSQYGTGAGMAPGSDQGWVLPWSAPAMEKPLGFTDKVSSIGRGNLLAPHYLPMKQWVAVHGEAVPCTYQEGERKQHILLSAPGWLQTALEKQKL